jgi:antitoxin (DNA-binding transcriptional repressor) of toxin-antitoxin stability system
MSTLPEIIPISDLRLDTAGVIKRVTASKEPVVITQRGRASAVLRILARGDAEITAGKGLDAEDVMAEARALLAQE